MSIPKVVLYKSKTNSDGTHPIVIQWRENGKPKKRTVASVLPDHWNRKGNKVNSKNPMYQQINERINEMLGEAIVKGGLKKERSFGLIDFIKDEGVKSERLGRLADRDKYNQMIADLKEFDSNIEDKGLDGFTDQHAEQFYLFLREKNAKNTCARKMSRLGTIFKRAKMAKLTTNDPTFGMVFEREKVIKSKLNAKEMKAIENLPDEGLTKWGRLARDVFVLQYYLRGLRVGDAISLVHEDIVDGRLVFKEGKTGQIRNLPIRPEVQALIDKYNGSSVYLIPALRFVHDKKKTDAENMLVYKQCIETATAALNRGLKEIAKKLGFTKHLTTHIARHTFTKMAHDQLKDTRLTQGLLAHQSMQSHQIYLKDFQDDSELDEAADKVFR